MEKKFWDVRDIFAHELKKEPPYVNRPRDVARLWDWCVDQIEATHRAMEICAALQNRAPRLRKNVPEHVFEKLHRIEELNEPPDSSSELQFVMEELDERLNILRDIIGELEDRD